MHVDVAVLGWPADLHVSAVVNHLDAAGVTSACFDQVTLWEDTATFEPGTPRLRIGERELSSCSLVWNRRAYPTMIYYMSPHDRTFARAEFNHALFGAMHALSGDWFNTPAAIQRASYKAAQLHVAARDRRLRVPRSLITSNATAARSFMAGQRTRYVVKPLHVSMIETDRGFATVYTSLLDARLRVNLADIANAPCIIQEFVERDCDIRLNVIGERVFATRLDTGHIAGTKADSRRVPDYHDIVHTPIEPPETIASACRDMCRHFGLRFGAFDFAVAKSGEWFFLEVNPNGQWYWIEEMTGQPLSVAMAEEILRQLGRRAPRKSRRRSAGT